MQNVGELLKNFIETNNLKKAEVAQRAEISPAHLSTLFSKEDMSCSLWEKVALAAGFDPAEAFDMPGPGSGSTAETHRRTPLSDGRGALLDLLNEKERIIQEKERTIQILLKTAGV